MEKKFRTANEVLLATGQMRPLIIRYALPSALGLVFFSLQSILDGIIVGRFIGSDALAGVNIVMPSYSLLTSVAIILGVGAQAQMGIAMGQMNYEKVITALRTGFISILAVAVVFCLFINIFPSEVATFLGADETLLPYSVDYIRGVMPFIIANACFYFFDYILRALGHPRFALGVMVASIMLNIVLSILFVVALDMGAFGVGLGTGFSVLLGGVASGAVVWQQIRRDRNLRNYKGRFSGRFLWRIFYNGSSEGVSEIAMGITLLVFNLALMEHAGKDGVAAFAVINYIIFIGTSIFLGVSNGIIPILSFNFGAGLWPRIKQAVRIVIRCNLIVGVLFLIFLWVGGEAVISLFLDKQEGASVINIAVNGAKIMGFAFLLNGFNIFAASFFTAVDNAKLSLIIASLRGLVLIIIGITLLPPLLGINGIWLTVPLTELFTAFASAFLLRRALANK